MSFRRAFLLGTAVLLAAAAAVFIIMAKPAPQATEGREDAAVEETAERPSAPTSSGEEPGEPPTSAPSGELQVVTEQAGEHTRLVFKFPDPAGGSPAPPPSGVYDTIWGHWVLEMLGALYGISNCHLVLEENDTISSPGDYSPVFEISGSEYRYEEANRSFEATLSVTLRMGTTETVPLDIKLTGKASPSLREITGSFVAVPLGEIYFAYGQQGVFHMYR